MPKFYSLVTYNYLQRGVWRSCLLKKVYNKRYNKTVEHPRGVTSGKDNLTVHFSLPSELERAPRLSHVLTSTMFVRACGLVGSRADAS